MGTEVQTLLEAGRAAAARRDWSGAHRDLVHAASQGELLTDDLLLLSDAAWWLGRMTETMSLSEQVHRRYVEEGRLDRAALSALGTGGLWLISGEVPIGLGWIARARRLLDGLPECEVHGYLLFTDASMALEMADAAAVTAATTRMRALARTFSSPTLDALALMLDGTLAIHEGRTAEGFAFLDEAMLPVLAGQVEDGFAGNIYCQVMGLCHDVGDVRRMRTWLHATETWCTQFTDAVMFIGICRVHRVQLHVLDGAWDAAVGEAERVRHDLADMNAAAVAEAHYQVAEVHRRRGQGAAAAQEYALARGLGRDPQPGEALLHLAEGRADAAWAEIFAALETATPGTRTRYLGPAVQIALADGRVGAAEELVDQLTLAATSAASPLFQAAALAARGDVLLARGQAAEAVGYLRDALRGYAELPAPFESMCVLGQLARAYAEAGHRVEAETAANGAAEARLRLGIPTVQEPGKGILTGRELDVLRRVATGASNREVAEQLSISDKTVGRHLANIYVKLGATSRTGAVARAREQRLL